MLSSTERTIRQNMQISTADTASITQALSDAQGTSTSALLGVDDVRLAKMLAEEMLTSACLTDDERVGTVYVFFSTTYDAHRKFDVTEAHMTRLEDGWALTHVERVTLSEKWEDYLLPGPHVPTLEEVGRRVIKTSSFLTWPGASLFTSEPIV
jgi:hypothetical protein